MSSCALLYTASPKQGGTNDMPVRNIKEANQLLILRHIALSGSIPRVDLAQLTGLSKMTVGNIANELIANHLISETDSVATTSHGRKPILLSLSPDSPCICGILIKRQLCQAILSDIGGSVFYKESRDFQSLSSSDELITLVKHLYDLCCAATQRRILAVGISCVGPLDANKGVILQPPFFYGIENLPIVSILREHSHLPVYLVHDATAGAFSEKLFGLGKDLPNFVYLHIMNGIGAGFVLNHALYGGDSGQSGEIGHTSINSTGPFCTCGNRGCLDLYANLDNMHTRIRELAPLYPASSLADMDNPQFNDILLAAGREDPIALAVMEQFCTYIASALTNALNLLNISNVIIGYYSLDRNMIIEHLLENRLNSMALSSQYHPVSVVHSSFDGDAPLIGSMAIIAERIFSGELKLDGTYVPTPPV